MIARVPTLKPSPIPERTFGPMTARDAVRRALQAETQSLHDPEDPTSVAGAAQTMSLQLDEGGRIERVEWTGPALPDHNAAAFRRAATELRRYSVEASPKTEHTVDVVPNLADLPWRALSKEALADYDLPVCVEGLILTAGEYASGAFDTILRASFDLKHPVLMMGNVTTLPDPEHRSHPDPPSGGRRDLLFYIHPGDTQALTLAGRLELGVRWWDSVRDNEEYRRSAVSIYPENLRRALLEWEPPALVLEDSP